jgi:hypothetical protein
LKPVLLLGAQTFISLLCWPLQCRHRCFYTNRVAIVHSADDGMVERDSISGSSFNILWALFFSCKCIPRYNRTITRAGFLTHLYALHVVLLAQETISGRSVHCNKLSLFAGKGTFWSVLNLSVCPLKSRIS